MKNSSRVTKPGCYSLKTNKNENKGRYALAHKYGNRIPSQYAREYWRELKKIIDRDRQQTWQAWREEIIPLIHAYRQAMEQPAVHQRGLRVNDALKGIQRVLDRIRGDAEGLIFTLPALERIIRRFVNQVNSYQRATFRRQVSRVLGFDPTAREPWLSSFLETAVRENVSLIKSIPVNYHSKIESIVIQGARRGTSINEISQQIAEVGGVSLRRGKFIARDQLGSLHGDLTKRRHVNAGLRRFRWRTAGDERVRGNPAGLYPHAKPSHWALDGKVFTWEKGAEEAGGLIPGEDYNCRCTAEIIEEDLLEMEELEGGKDG